MLHLQKIYKIISVIKMPRSLPFIFSGRRRGRPGRGIASLQNLFTKGHICQLCLFISFFWFFFVICQTIIPIAFQSSYRQWLSTCPIRISFWRLMDFPEVWLRRLLYKPKCKSFTNSMCYLSTSRF